MYRTNRLILLILILLLAAVPAAQARQGGPQTALGTAFTYQGTLQDGGSPANGAYDFEFKLFDAASDGAQVGSTLAVGDVTVSGGLVNLPLDFGLAAFDGQARWLEIAVRPGASTAAYTLLGRQALSAVPYALYALQAPWSGVGGLPAGFADGIDNNTTYTPGSGLKLTGTQFSADTDVLQARVTGNCAPGDAIQTINADGSVVCQPAPTPPPAAPLFTRSTLDSIANTGKHVSIAIGADGLGLIAYQDDTDNSLNVAHCEDLACTRATITQLDTTGNTGLYNSITIGSDGLGLISYHDLTNADLKVAHCNDAACTSAGLFTLDSAGSVGTYTAITTGADGLGLIGYRDGSNANLKAAHCSDAACTSAALALLDSVGDVGLYISIAAGADGLGLISYYDATNGDLKVAHCSDTACSSATLTPLDALAENVGEYTSIAIGADGLGLISYFSVTNGDLKIAHCSDPLCTAATFLPADTSGTVGLAAAITIGADGLGLVSYYDLTNGDLKVAHCDDVVCTDVTRHLVGSDGDVGYYTDIATGVDGLALIAYFDQGNHNLMAAHCDDADCAP